jgi:hypothetical protein
LPNYEGCVIYLDVPEACKVLWKSV